MMGCAEEDENCQSNEKPSHEVTIDYDFEMLETEVTQEQFNEVYDYHPNTTHACPACAQDMTWWADDATKYCEAVGGRLPSEAEWEYAALGGGPPPYGCTD